MYASIDCWCKFFNEFVRANAVQVVVEATDGGGRSSQAIVVVLATHAEFGLASLAPLPGMETFVPNPAAFGTTPASVTSAGRLRSHQCY